MDIALVFNIAFTFSKMQINLKKIWFPGDGIQKLYFPILVPVGIVGNFLSFMVRTHGHSSQKSLNFLLYLMIEI